MRASHIVALVLLLAVFFWLNVVPLFHSDIWGHLLFGKWIVTNQALPTHEPFSPFSDSGHELVHFQWLTQAVYYVTYQAGAWLAGGDAWRQLAGGANALRFLHALVGLIEWIFLLAAYRRVCNSLPLACAGLAFLAFMRLGTLGIQRPQVFGTLWFAILIFCLVKPRLSNRAIIGLAVVFALWANTHGSFLVGFLLIAVFALGRSWQLMREDGPRALLGDAVLARYVVLGLLALLVVAFANPHGPYLIVAAIRLSSHPNFAYLQEWLPLDFSQAQGGHWLYLAMLILLAASLAASSATLSATGVLTILVFGLPPLLQQRMMVWWIVLWPVLVLPLWGRIGQALPWPWLHYESVPSFRKTLLGGFLAILALMWTIPGQSLIGGRPPKLEATLTPATPWQLAMALDDPTGKRLFQNGDATPKTAEDKESRPRFETASKAPKGLQPLTATLAKSYPAGRYRGAIFASEQQADFLLWKLGSEHPLVIYSHVHLFDERHWTDYVDVAFARPEATEILSRLGVNLVVYEGGALAALTQKLAHDPEWLLMDSPPLVVAVRKKPL